MVSLTDPTSYEAFYTAQKMKFSTTDFFSICDQMHRKLRIWSHLLKKSVMRNFIFCAVLVSFTNSIYKTVWYICTILKT